MIKISHRATRTKEEESGTATLQKRLFGRKNSQNDPLPVVLLSYKADYDEILPQGLSRNGAVHRLRTPNEGRNQRYLKNWADVADQICFGRT